MYSGCPVLAGRDRALGKREWGGRLQVVLGTEQEKPSPAPGEQEE